MMIGNVARGVAVCVVVFAVTFTGCKSKTPAVDDTSISVALQSRLKSDTGLAGEAVQSTVQGGVVTLSGIVSNEAARSLAANDAAEIAGVRTVENNLTLGFSPKASAPANKQNAPVASHRVEERAARADEASNRTPSVPVERREPSQVDSQRLQPNRPVPPPVSVVPAFRNVTVPVGTGISVRITQTLDSATTQPGSGFSGVLASDVTVDGLTAFPTGTRVTGHVDDAKDAGHFSGNSLLAISLTGINRRGESLIITTDTFSKEGKGRGKNTAEKVGGGAAVGAILGGIFGGGKGAAIGAGAGGGLGAGSNAVTRGEQVQIPSESLVRFRLTSAVTVRASTAPEGDTGVDLRRHDQ